MPKKHKKGPRPRLLKADSQIPISRVCPIDILGPRYYLQHARQNFSMSDAFKGSQPKILIPYP
jgi:hypothetical protein